MKGNHSCGVCGKDTTFTITSLDQMICDNCKTIVSSGKKVRELRLQMSREETVERLEEEEEGMLEPGMPPLNFCTKAEIKELHSITVLLLRMFNEASQILNDNKLLVGDLWKENRDAVDQYRDKLLELKERYGL